MDSFRRHEAEALARFERERRDRDALERRRQEKKRQEEEEEKALAQKAEQKPDDKVLLGTIGFISNYYNSHIRSDRPLFYLF